MPTLTENQIEGFIRSGFTIVPGVVSDDRLRAAQQAIDASPNGSDVPPLHTASESNAVLSLLFDTTLKSMVEDILGPWQRLSIRDKSAQIASTPPNVNVNLHDNVSEQSWHVDSSHGKYAGVASDFLLLVGVALSEGQENDENRGQLIAFPGTFSSNGISVHLVRLALSDVQPTAFSAEPELRLMQH